MRLRPRTYRRTTHPLLILHQITAMNENTENQTRLSGGETEDRADYLKLRGLILQEADVYACLALSWVPRESRWLYLIQTPFATWPKYVVGLTDQDNKTPEILMSCGMRENALAFFNEQNEGDHQ